MFSLFALVPLLAVLLFTDVEVKSKAILTVVYLAIWGLTWLTGWAYFGLLLYGAFIYFMYFGSGPGRNKR